MRQTIFLTILGGRRNKILVAIQCQSANYILDAMLQTILNLKKQQGFKPEMLIQSIFASIVGVIF